MILERIEAGLKEERLGAELEYLALLRSGELDARWAAERLFEAAYGDAIRRMLGRAATNLYIRDGQVLDIDFELVTIRQAFFDVIADQEAHAADHNMSPKAFWKDELSKATKRGQRRSLKWLVSRIAYAHNRGLFGL